jgi:hypothetical protein
MIIEITFLPYDFNVLNNFNEILFILEILFKKIVFVVPKD